jgi:hypothetical protein
MVAIGVEVLLGVHVDTTAVGVQLLCTRGVPLVVIWLPGVNVAEGVRAAADPSIIIKTVTNNDNINFIKGLPSLNYKFSED